MNFKNIISEALIDELPIPKIEKHIAKEFYKSDAINMDPKDVGKMINDIINKISVPADMVVKIYFLYKKYGDLLFADETIKLVEEYDTLAPELYDITKKTLITYLHQNYNGKSIFSYEGIDGEIYFMEDIDFMMAEDMWPEIYVTMPVTGSYTYTYTPYREEPREETTDDVAFAGSVYFSMLPYKSKEGYHPMGFDFTIHSHETFGDWYKKIKGGEYVDVIDSGKIKGSFFTPPKNLTEPEIKRVCEQWIEVCKRIIKRSAGLLLEYKDFIEHDGGVFEGYNRKIKTIK